MKWRWVLAVMLVGTLGVYAAFLWWFGPYYAMRGVGAWMLLSVPLFFVSYAVARARWMMHAGYILIPLGMILSVVQFPNLLENDSPTPSIVGLACAVPVMLAAAWALSMFAGPMRESMLRVVARTLSPICLIGVTVVGGTIWATPEERPAMPQYAASFTGCYELTFGRWFPRGAEARRVVSRVIPLHIRLDDGKLGRRLVQPRWWGGDGIWTPTGPRDLQLSTSPGFGGMDVIVHRGAGGVLRGRADIYSDAPGFLPEPRALATLRPEDCASLSAESAGLLPGVRVWE